MSMARDLTVSTTLRRIRGGDIPVPSPVPWREQRRQRPGHGRATASAAPQGAWWRVIADVDAGFAFAFTLAMLFISIYGTLTAALIAGLTPAYVFFRRGDLVRAVAARSYLLIFPVFALLSTVWSDAPKETLRFAMELVITLTAALLLSASARPTAVIFAIALAFFIYVGDAAVHGHQVTMGSAGSFAFSGLTDSKNLIADIAGTGLLFSIAALACAIHERRWAWAPIFCLAMAPEAFAMIAARSAGAILGLAVALSAFGALLTLSKGSRAVRASVTLMIGLLVAACALNYATLATALIDIGTKVFDKDATLTGRTYLWYRAHDVMDRAPLLGQGFSSFWLQGNVAAEGLWQYGGIADRAGFSFHNTPIELRVGVGWLGAAIFFGALAVGAVLLVRRFVRSPSVPLVLWMSLMLYECARMGIEAVGFQQFAYSTLLLFVALGAGAQKVAPRPPAQRIARSPIGTVSYVSADISASSLRLRPVRTPEHASR